jgi:hypothetical protein
LKAAARRDALVRWARDAWRAATASETPSHSVSSLEKLVKAAGEVRGERERDLGETAATFETATTSETAATSSEKRTATFETATSEPKRSAPPSTETETILFVVDVSAPQVNFEGKDGTGRVLVAATEGRVVGRRVRSTSAPGDVSALNPSGGSRQEVKVTLRRAQAHVAPTDVDVYAGVQWLDASAIRDAAANGARSTSADAPSGGGYLLRRVFEPCSMDLAFVTKEPEPRVEAKTTRVEAKTRARPPEALTEFALESPEIEAELTAEQFAALVDVVGSVFLAQYPSDATPPPAVAAARLLANTNRSLVDAEDRASAAVVAAPLAKYKEVTWRLNERLVDDRESRLASRTSSKRKAFSSTSSRLRESCLLALRSAARDAETATAEAVSEAEALVRPHRRRPAIALRLEIARFRWAMRSGGRSFLVARVDAMRLARERHSDTSGVTRLSLGDLKLDVPAPASAGRKQHAGGPPGTIRADEKHREKEKIIFTKPVFARWDPDAPEDERVSGGFSASRSFGGKKSSEKSDVDTTDSMNDRSPTFSSSDANEPPCDDHPSSVEGGRNPLKPLVSIEARRAASPPEAPVWDAIEVSVEPFDLHLESETYGVLVRYLFPEKRASGSRVTELERAANLAAFERNARASKSRSEIEKNENEHAREALRGRFRDASSRGLDAASSSETTRGASASASASATAEAEEKARVMLLGHGPRVGKHARAKTWGADLFGGGGGGGVPAAEPKQFSTPTKPRRGRALTAPEGTHKRKHTLVTRDPVASTLAERAPRPFPLTVDDADAERDEKHHSRSSTTRAAESRESSRAMANGVFRDARGDGRERDAAILPANAYSPKVVVVHHLKVNDVALRVSYDGPPKKFHEVRLLLDASTHAAFVGRWRELIDRVKKKIVWSVLKSVTGLQGRRLPGAGSAGTGSAGTGSDVAAGEASARRGFGAFGNVAKGIKVRFGDGGGDALQATSGGSDGNILRVPEGFEGFEGDLDFAEGLTALGSPTAAAMVAESDGLVVPAGRANAAGASVWARVFGGARGV